MQVDYKQIIDDSIALSVKIDFAKYKAIHPIPAGGIAVGITMAIHTQLPVLSVEEYKNYKDKKEVLVVDDLVDSGKTLLRYKKSDTAVLYKKPHSPEPTYYLTEISEGWVSLPHEKDKTGILDHVIRVFEFAGINLTEKEQEKVINILKLIKK